MKACIIGNCQIAALRPLLQALHGDLDSLSLPAVHMMRGEHEKLLHSAADGADWIIAQLVAPNYPVEYVRTAVLREKYGDRLIVWPNLYFSGYAPEYNTLRHAGLNNFTGPLLDYHNDKILFGFMEGWSVEETTALVGKHSSLDELWYDDSVSASLTELRRREQQTDVAISDFVEQAFARQRLFYIMNHPSITLMVELAVRILRRMEVPPLGTVQSSLFADLELLSAWHPDNAYIRKKHGFSFSGPRLYRGVRLVPADTPLGVSPQGPRIFQEQEFVEAMFRFYEPHTAVLREHQRVRQILDRPRP